MTDGYESWWNVGIATTSSKESVRKACEEFWKEEEKQEITKNKTAADCEAVKWNNPQNLRLR